METNYNPVENTFIAARIPIELKDRLDSYASMNWPAGYFVPA